MIFSPVLASPYNHVDDRRDQGSFDQDVYGIIGDEIQPPRLIQRRQVDKEDPDLIWIWQCVIHNDRSNRLPSRIANVVYVWKKHYERMICDDRRAIKVRMRVAIPFLQLR